MMLRAGAVLGGLAAMCGARDAEACSPMFDPGLLARPVFEPADAARIESETIDVDCGATDCRVSATYRIVADREARVTVDGHRVRDLALAVDGAAGSLVPAGARELRVAATVEMWVYGDPCYMDGIIARHPWFAPRPPRTQRVLTIETEARPEVHHPSAWRLEIRQGRAYQRRFGERTIARLWFQLPQPRMLHGGPFALAGIAGGAGGALRLRAGWEIAAPRWLILAVAADTDASSSATLAATAEATSRAWIGFPSTSSAGGGVIVAVAPEIRPGVRGQLSIAAGRVRLVVSGDVLAPVASGQSLAASVGVLAGVSL